MENQKCLIEIYNDSTGKCDWVQGFITGYIAGDTNADFERINVMTEDSREFRGCHPECIKEVAII